MSQRAGCRSGARRSTVKGYSSGGAEPKPRLGQPTRWVAEEDMSHPSLCMRSIFGSTLVVARLLVGPSPSAVPPDRTTDTPQDFTIPAGEGCPDFAVDGSPSEKARRTVTQFADGRVVTHGSAVVTLTNANTGTSFTQNSHYMLTDTVDLEAGKLFTEIHGRIFVAFWPGDIGPDGSVLTEPTLLSLVGRQTITMDLETFAFESYSLNGQVLDDVCGVLAG